MKTINLEAYPRRSHFEFFRKEAYPYVGFTATVDVTRPLAAAKIQGGSGFLAILWTAMRALNRVPELRQRILGDGIVEFDHCDCSHTVPLSNGTFTACRTAPSLPLEEYLVAAGAAQERAKANSCFLTEEDDELSLVFASCVPWIGFTQVIQPTPIPSDSNPRLTMGKYDRKSDGRVEMPLAILANHALVDGRHLGLFYQYFQEIVDSL